MPGRSEITASTKVAALLLEYPELEELLISMSPAFVKLRNPVLRRSVARVATLGQAAAVGRLDVAEFVNELRVAAGQRPLVDVVVEEIEYFGPAPGWFDQATVVKVLREQELDPDVMPINPLLRAARDLDDGDIVELITAHLPAPGIDILRRKGYSVWSVERDGSIHTFVGRPATA
ncbi:MAG: DUF1858 domain-containing protein [Acidimicrobiia bacterium]